MAVWLPTQNKFYLPPQPITKILSTDDYVERTPYFYHASTDKLLTVGHPYYPIFEADKTTVKVPKVSPNQFRVFRLKLPDPNTFAFGDKCIYNPENERLVWACRGVEVSRGGPLGAAITGNPLFNRFFDTENPFTYPVTLDDNKYQRYNVTFDPKQTQMILLGCKPAVGEHWKRSTPCAEKALQETECPPIELTTSAIEDGDMMDIGLGNMDFKTLQENKSEAPLDVLSGPCKYPDFIHMEEDLYGDALFFFARRETLYTRHMFLRGGAQGDETPLDKLLKTADTDLQRKVASDAYISVPSGSLISSESQLFNRPYWLQRAQGQNNGIAWHNELFLTVADNTRGTVLAVNKAKQNKQNPNDYRALDYYEFVRHTEEYQIGLILQLCKISLSPENLAFVHTMDPTIVEEWHLSAAAPSSDLHDHYRYITSRATKCPDAVPPEKPVDRYKDLKFWEVDLSERITDQLDQTALGRKFLYQSGLGRRTTRRVSVPRNNPVCTKSTCKRKRKTTCPR